MEQAYQCEAGGTTKCDECTIWIEPGEPIVSFQDKEFCTHCAAELGLKWKVLKKCYYCAEYHEKVITDFELDLTVCEDCYNEL